MPAPVIQMDIPSREIAEYKDAFSRFDPDGTGEIQTDDLGPLTREMGFWVSESETFDLIDEVDPKHTGLISFDTFMEVLAPRFKIVFIAEDLHDAFRIFNKKGNGLISMEELEAAALSIGEILSEDDIEAMLNEGDRNKDDHLSFEEFVNLATKYF